MYPDLLTGDLSPPREVSASSPHYPSLMDTSIDELEQFLDDKATDSYPAYIEVDSVNQSFKCIWCDRTLLGGDQLDMHLRGKEHTKRCANSDISPYGSESHDSEVRAYVAQYGHDLYARLVHWPDLIQVTDQYYRCSKCQKNFQTQKSVNQHLIDTDHAGRGVKAQRTEISDGYASLTESLESIGFERPATWPACIVEEGDFWRCTLCDKKFNSSSIVEDHLVHPKHVGRVGVSTQSVGRPPSPPGVEQLAQAKQRRENFAKSINFEEKYCSICFKRFSTLREAEDHVDELSHLGNYLAYIIDNQPQQ